MVQSTAGIICLQGSYPIPPESLKPLTGEEAEAQSYGERLQRMLRTRAPTSASRFTHRKPGAIWRSCWRHF